MSRFSVIETQITHTDRVGDDRLRLNGGRCGRVVVVAVEGRGERSWGGEHGRAEGIQHNRLSMTREREYHRGGGGDAQDPMRHHDDDSKECGRRAAHLYRGRRI